MQFWQLFKIRQVCQSKYAFSALTLSVGRQEEHPACKNYRVMACLCNCVVICLQRSADCLQMVQLMPLHLKIPSSIASFKSGLVLPFWYWITQVVVVLEKMPLNGCSNSSLSVKKTGIY